jgi:hypothetical protein
MPLGLDELNQAHTIASEKTPQAYLKAANYLLEQVNLPRVRDIAHGETVIRKFFRKYLDEADYISAATLVLGRQRFDGRPVLVKEVCEAMKNNARIAIPGGSSLGKSYTAVIWLLMDYVRDPHFTKIMFASVDGDHLKRNIFSDLAESISASCIDLGLEVSINDLEVYPRGSKERNWIISGRTFPRDDNKASGRFRGFKPTPRGGNQKHPIFGTHGRARLLLDEASNMPGGVYKDLPSIEASIKGTERVKIIAAFNPDSTAHWTYQICEPKTGWKNIDPEADQAWLSKEGWAVTRLDGARSENVAEQKDLYEGMQTYEAHLGFAAVDSRYWTYARGFWPLKGTAYTLMSRDLLNKCSGQYVFMGGATPCATLDVAFTKDKAILTIGRYGKAISVIRDGKRAPILDAKGNPSSRWALQVEQQIQLESKDNTIFLSEECMRFCRELGVAPEWLAVDATGSGKGVYDYLRSYFGNVMPIIWSNKATDKKSFLEESLLPCDAYSNIVSEMWYTAREWISYGCLLISDDIPDEPLRDELVKREAKNRGGKAAVESKLEYRARTGKNSPDYADSFVMLPMLCKSRAEIIPSQTGSTELAFKDEQDYGPRIQFLTSKDIRFKEKEPEQRIAPKPQVVRVYRTFSAPTQNLKTTIV